MERLAAVLARHEITASILGRAESLERTVGAWLPGVDGTATPLLDVSSASGGTAARAVLAMQRSGRPFHMCWFSETSNEVHLSSGGDPEALAVDIGSKASVRSAVSPRDFMAVFGLERLREDPYCGADRDTLVAPASAVLRIAIEHSEAYRHFRQVLAAVRQVRDCLIPAETIPAAVRPVLDVLASLDGWIRTEDDRIVFCGGSGTPAVFFLSGGWLEVVVAEAIRRALPDHKVQINCGATWGRRPRAEAEMDVAFVYHNALYLLSCKNDHLTDRFFPHLDRFRALTAEFGESRTRPVLLSTAELAYRHIRRCDAYEIGQISGRPLLELIDRSLMSEPDALLKGLLTVSRGAPRAGLS